MRPLLATILCIIWEIWSGSNNEFHIFVGNFFFFLNCVTTPILKPTYDQKPDFLFFVGLIYISAGKQLAVTPCEDLSIEQ